LKNFGLRTITGAIFVAILTSTILFHPITFFILFLVVLIIGIFEFAKLFPNGSKLLFYSSLSISIVVFCLAFLIAWGKIDPRFFALLIPLILWVFVKVLFTQTSNPIQLIAYTFLPVLYLALPLSLLCYTGFIGGNYSGKLLMTTFFLIWTNDSGAYLSGVSFGKHKMFPRISPKKSWEGTIGGLILTLIISYILSIYWMPMSGIQFVLLAITVSVFATLGDLTESMFKRSADVKDSGNILPGHGGILDRFDSLLFVAPAVAFLFYMFEIFSL